MPETELGSPAAGASRGRGGRSRRGSGGAGSSGGRARRGADREAERAQAKEAAAGRMARDPESVARDLCLTWLTMRPHTRAELAAKLRRREVPPEAAEAVLLRFDEVGLVDDQAFARAWVESRHAGRGLARRALASELRARGVSGDTVEEAVAELDPETEAATARQLVERRLKAMSGLTREVQTRRLLGLLARKGYGGGTAARTVREVLDAARDAADADADDHAVLLRQLEDESEEQHRQ